MTNLPAGRELDAAVAKVLGKHVHWKHGHPFSDEVGLMGFNTIANYSTSTAAAIEALEEWKRQLSGQRTYQIIAHDTGEYTVSVSELKGWGADWWELKHADAPTLAHAAALALVATAT